MAHDSNGKISRPVDVYGDVAAVLGVPSGDVAYLCSNQHNQINPASKIKPIRHDALELLEADFRGSSADIGQGIYFGLKIAATATKWTTLHDSTLTYYPPVPGTNWCRLTDFNGYDHNARFNPQGTIQADRIVIGNDVDVILRYSEENTTGVDIAQMTGLDLANGFKDFYPCVMVSNAAKTLHYVRALNRVSGTNTLAPSKFYVDNGYFWDWSFPLTGSDVPSILQSSGEVYVTVFFVQQINDPGVMNLNSWTQWTSDRTSRYSAFACPNATNIKLKVEPLNKEGIKVIGVSVVKRGNYYQCSATWGYAEPTVGATYTVTVEVKLSDGHTTSNSMSVTVPSNYNSALRQFLNWDTNIVSLASGTTGTYTYTVKIGSVTTASGNGNASVLIS